MNKRLAVLHLLFLRWEAFHATPYPASPPHREGRTLAVLLLAALGLSGDHRFAHPGNLCFFDQVLYAHRQGGQLYVRPNGLPFSVPVQAWRQVPRWDVLLYQLGATWVVVPLSKVSYSPDNVVDTFYPKAV
jgi:hypothetical protein